jgi:septal ring factor EnvC (AmiA/AmiB activator)
MALNIMPRDLDSATKSLTTLKAELVEAKTICKKAQVEAETLARAVKELKKTTDQFLAQVPALEEKVKHLNNTILDLLTEL